MKKIILLLIIGLIPIVTYGAPNITAVSGTTTNGSIITITGSGFGTKTPSPIATSFDNATPVYNWSSGTLHTNWEPISGQDGSVLITANPRTPWPQSSHKASYDAAGGYDVLGWNHMQREDKIYVSWWTYNDYVAFDGIGGGNSKWMRLYSSDLSGPPTGGNGMVFSNEWGSDGSLRKTYGQAEYSPDCPGWSIDYTATGTTISNANSFGPKFQGANQTLQTWEHWEIYFTFSTSFEASQDQAIIMKDGQTVLRTSNVSLQKADTHDGIRALRLGQPSGGRGSSQIEYIDQIYFDSTFQHVFLSDASTLSFPDIATVNLQEVQVASAWNDGSITVTVNQGLIPNGQAYLYVMDADGVINTNGYAVTLGGADVTPPTLTQTTPIHTPTTNHTPNYTFSSTEPGTITYGGDCSSSTTSASSGNNTITLNNLPNGTYSNCTITVTDSSNNTSNPLTITSFTINTSSSTTNADVDQSGTINTIDALLTLRNALGLNMNITNWFTATNTGNVNCDGNSNTIDSLLILRNSLGLDMSGTGWCVSTNTYTLTVTDPGNNDTITATGINCGNGNTDCSEEYAENTEVVLTATASAGREWVSWSGDVTGSSVTSGSVIMDANKTATANFQATSGIDCNNLSYEHLNGGTGPAAVGNSESRNAYRGVYWTGENKRICKGEFRVHVTGDVSGINYKVTLWSVDTQNDLELDTLLATSNIISGASLSDGVWMPFEFSTPQDVISGKTVFLVSRNDVGTKDGSNFIQVYQDYDESDSESRAWNSHYSISGTMEGRHPGDENQPEYFTIPLRLYGENTALAGAAPNMPENINVTAVNSTTLNIDWVEKGVIGVDHYNVYEYNTGDASKILVGTVSAPTTEYQHTGLTSGTTHYYVVTAVTAAGIEGYHSVDRHQSSGDPDWEGTTL